VSRSIAVLMFGPWDRDWNGELLACRNGGTVTERVHVQADWMSGRALADGGVVVRAAGPSTLWNIDDVFQWNAEGKRTASRTLVLRKETSVAIGPNGPGLLALEPLSDGARAQFYDLRPDGPPLDLGRVQARGVCPDQPAPDAIRAFVPNDFGPYTEGSFVQAELELSSAGACWRAVRKSNPPAWAAAAGGSFRGLALLRHGTRPFVCR
jgi:hypothetical protein